VMTTSDIMVRGSLTFCDIEKNALLVPYHSGIDRKVEWTNVNVNVMCLKRAEQE
jgi:hypothetical protein